MFRVWVSGSRELKRMCWPRLQHSLFRKSLSSLCWSSSCSGLAFWPDRQAVGLSVSTFPVDLPYHPREMDACLSSMLKRNRSLICCLNSHKQKGITCLRLTRSNIQLEGFFPCFQLAYAGSSQWPEACLFLWGPWKYRPHKPAQQLQRSHKSLFPNTGFWTWLPGRLSARVAGHFSLLAPIESPTNTKHDMLAFFFFPASYLSIHFSGDFWIPALSIPHRLIPFLAPECDSVKIWQNPSGVHTLFLSPRWPGRRTKN